MGNAVQRVAWWPWAPAPRRRWPAFPSGFRGPQFSQPSLPPEGAQQAVDHDPPGGIHAPLADPRLPLAGANAPPAPSSRESQPSKSLNRCTWQPWAAAGSTESWGPGRWCHPELRRLGRSRGEGTGQASPPPSLRAPSRCERRLWPGSRPLCPLPPPPCLIVLCCHVLCPRAARCDYMPGVVRSYS